MNPIVQRVHGPHLRRSSPSCCGDPGGNTFPGSFVWDRALHGAPRPVLSEHAAPGGPDDNVWPLGELAHGTSASRRGSCAAPIGSFEGIVTDGRHAVTWRAGRAIPTSRPRRARSRSPYGAALGLEGSVLLTAPGGRSRCLRAGARWSRPSAEGANATGSASRCRPGRRPGGVRLRHRPQRAGRAVFAPARREEDRARDGRRRQAARRHLHRLGRASGLGQVSSSTSPRGPPTSSDCG